MHKQAYNKTVTPIISVIITTWNNFAFLPRCLNCLATQTYKDFEVILVDNGSTDGCVDEAQIRWPELALHVERLFENKGFAVGNNVGAQIARGHWLALLNADSFPEVDWLKKLVRAADENPEFFSFSSRQIQDKDPDRLDGSGDAYHVSGLAWRIGLGYPANNYGLESCELFSPCAAAAMYSRKAFLDIHGFDEDFFSYFEDVDLGFRLQLKGYRCLYVPDAVVRHVGSVTFGERSDFAFYHSHRNLIWTFVKNMPAEMFWLYLPAHLIANLVYLIYYALRGKGKVLLRAKLDAIWGLPKAIHKRREIQKHINVRIPELKSRMQHGWFQPYLLGYNRRKAIRAQKS